MYFCLCVRMPSQRAYVFKGMYGHVRQLIRHNVSFMKPRKSCYFIKFFLLHFIIYYGF